MKRLIKYIVFVFFILSISCCKKENKEVPCNDLEVSEWVLVE